MDISELETPCLILDRPKLERNITAMGDRLSRFDVDFRPHGKTAKCFDVMRPALAGQFGGITVSTLKEAEYFFGHGVTDILYAVGIAPVKLPRIAELIRRGAGITIILDSLEQARATARKARELKVRMPVLIEIDSDGHRAGVKPDDPALVEIGRLLHGEAGVALKGVMTHAGGSYDCRSTDAIRACAAAERDAAVKSAEVLRRHGLPCPVVSIGSTPTAWFAEDLAGVTEVRAGVYMFFDLVMADLQVCTVEDIALSVLGSVIGYQKSKGWVMTDAGWMALSRDRGTANQPVDQGYGLVCDVRGQPMDDLIVTGTNQEHGIIAHRHSKPLDFEAFPIGGGVRILPNHACATAAMHDWYYVTDGSTRVVDTWRRINQW
jgi:D-serine deaminase-like pyridoxal phosphate-dependent protein